jgi:GT2 family glycosyltransferase
MSKQQSGILSFTVVIPTFGREDVLINTVRQFLDERPAAAEILVIDQTPEHEPDTEQHLRAFDERGDIKWIRLQHPSQPAALNRGLLEATQPVVLFLDDDIEIAPGLVSAHARNYEDEEVWAVAGQILQPMQDELKGWKHVPSNGPYADCEFPFNSDTRAWIRNGMSGNLSVRREPALALGGFDENFVPPVAYRFDMEFCKRLCRAGGKILFEPAARIHHLRCERGGTRSRGSHLTSASPIHGVGDYYFAFRQWRHPESLVYLLRRPLREVCTRYHLRHPWWIPVKLIGELRALSWAALLHCRGPRCLAFSREAKERSGQRTNLGGRLDTGQ